MNRVAVFKNGIRIGLSREWDKEGVKALVLMYYPSTADDIKDDTTFLRTIQILKNNNYGGFILLNIEKSVNVLEKYDLKQFDVIVAWGGKISEQKQNEILQTISKQLDNSKPLKCFCTIKGNRPGMPTRLSYSTRIQLF